MPNEPTKASQDFVDIREVRDGIIYTKSNRMCRILIVSGINFDLKSDAEQNLILNSFQNFLNTIDFPVQFFIHSRKVNINAYLAMMGTMKEKEQNELLKIQIEDYISFVKSLVEENAIISKAFFVIVSYQGISAVPGDVAGGILSLFKKNESKKQENKAPQEHLEQLGHRVDQVTQGLESIGLRALPLEDEEIVELFYNLYNPQLVEKKGMEINK